MVYIVEGTCPNIRSYAAFVSTALEKIIIRCCVVARYQPPTKS